MSAQPLPLGATIGIVGGGQLGRMSAIAASRLGFRAHVLTDEADSPAAQVCNAVTVASYDNFAALDAFAASVDVITFEFENLSAEGLARLSGRAVRPSADVLRVSQDRVAEKAFLEGAGVRTAAWRAVANEADLAAGLASLGLPAVLKTTRLGYDGRGQAVLREPGDAARAFAALSPKPLILEAFVPFAAEISVIVARGADGATAAFDAVENAHRDHILDRTFAPARVTPAIAAAAREAALRVAARLDLVGVLCLEMFVDANGRVLGNEIAPRPHNSGHWTLDACPHSQFDLHIRAVAGLPLPAASRHSDAVMQNLVGPQGAALWPAILADGTLVPHWYGKAEARAGRKMGHVTRLFPRDGMPGAHGIGAALATLARG